MIFSMAVLIATVERGWEKKTSISIEELLAEDEGRQEDVDIKSKEIKALCKLFKIGFDYLFAEDEERGGKKSGDEKSKNLRIG